MERRELLKMIAVLTGTAMVGGDFILSGCNAGGGSATGFSKSQVSLLDEIAETIIPTTQTPGAKAAAVGEYMKVMVTDCYRDDEQKAFLDGIKKLQEACKQSTSKGFEKCSPEQRHDFLVSLEKEAKSYNEQRNERIKTAREAHDLANKDLPWKQQTEFFEEPPHYYTLMKQLTLSGYFTSEIGATKTLRHVAVPGKFDGNYPYTKGEKAWG